MFNKRGADETDTVGWIMKIGIGAVLFVAVVVFIYNLSSGADTVSKNIPKDVEIKTQSCINWAKASLVQTYCKDFTLVEDNLGNKLYINCEYGDVEFGINKAKETEDFDTPECDKLENGQSDEARLFCLKLSAINSKDYAGGKAIVNGKNCTDILSAVGAVPTGAKTISGDDCIGLAGKIIPSEEMLQGVAGTQTCTAKNLEFLGTLTDSNGVCCR